MLILHMVVMFWLFGILHILLMTGSAKALGIVLREVSFGFGPSLFSIGLVQVRLFPLGGSIKMKDTREDGGSDSAGAFDRMPVWKRFLLPLLAPLCLVGLAFLILQDTGVEAFSSAFAQIWNGAWSPLSTAQEYLARVEIFARASSMADLFALVCIKLCAFNLLPFPPLNGGQALLAIGKTLGLTNRAEIGVISLFIWLVMYLWFSWLVALWVFV